MNLQDFFEHFKLDCAQARQTLDDTDVDTIGGFVTELLSELPRVGQKIVYQHLRVKVIKVQSMRIEKIRVVRTLDLEPETKIV
jgi:CBS domain containing-hemolysin-like protein